MRLLWRIVGAINDSQKTNMDNSTDTAFHFSPHCGKFWEHGEVLYGPGWRVRDDRGESWVFDDRDCAFASKRDCQAACDALNELNISYDSLIAMNDDEFGAVIVKYLNW